MSATCEKSCPVSGKMENESSDEICAGEKI